MRTASLARACLPAAVALLAFNCPAGLAAGADDEAAFRDLYRELVETNTTLSSGNCTAAAEAMAARLRTAGLPEAAVQVIVPPDQPAGGALIADYAGKEPRLKPIMLLAHIDVVEARREDWPRDPFKLVEQDGYFHGRGASDDKAMAAVFTDMLIRFRKEGFRPRRTVRLALTCGEETPQNFNGVRWLLATRPELMQARLVLNEGAGGLLDAAGRPLTLEIQAGEKVYQNFQLETTSPGGHSARPVRENAIARLSAALVRVTDYRFPIRLNPTTRAYFARQAQLVTSPQVATDMRAVLADPADTAAADRLWTVNPVWNGMLRTTCAVTQVEGGHAANALPQHVRATVNCRILPDESIDSVQRQLATAVQDERVSITPVGETGFTTSVPPLSEELLGPVRKAAAKLWPGVTVLPTMSSGATDGRYLNRAGIPTYGLSGMFFDAEGSHAHGADERIRVRSLLEGRRFLYEVVRSYAQLRD